MNFIEIEEIGKLTQHKDFSDWYESQPFPIRFFDGKKLKIVVSGVDESDPELVSEAVRVIQNFLSKDENEKFDYSNLVYENYREFSDAVGEDFFEISDENEIWKYVYPSQIYLSRRFRRDRNIYLEIHCDCEWEEEHGLQLVFRQGLKLTRVSAIDGHMTEADAFDKPDSEDELLSKF